jgi:hypothetical protein
MRTTTAGSVAVSSAPHATSGAMVAQPSSEAMRGARLITATG